GYFSSTYYDIEIDTKIKKNKKVEKIIISLSSHHIHVFSKTTTLKNNCKQFLLKIYQLFEIIHNYKKPSTSNNAMIK
ncbi:MAG: hypothetical protein Q4Q24_03685, partial [Methanobrevibacter ruminantium]|uniref:hypothetical protein n=1 Tax=Methanobrevibacter ruminantium TaxID=83816 RepID=UPI0026F2BBD9